MRKTTLTLIKSHTLGLALGLAPALSVFVPAVSLAAPAAQVQPAQGGQPGRPHGQPAQLSGTVARYFVGPLGHVRGFVLNGPNTAATTVLLPGKAGDQMAAAVSPGQTVRVEGMLFGKAQVLRHARVFGKDGKLLVEPMGKQARMERQARMADPAARAQFRQAHQAAMQQNRERIAQLGAYSASGTIQTVLRGHGWRGARAGGGQFTQGGPGAFTQGNPGAQGDPGAQGGRGMIRGLLLTDGTTVFLPHRLAEQLGRGEVRPGQTIQASGRGAAYQQGASVLAEQITLQDGRTLSAPLPAGPAGNALPSR